MNRVLVVGAPRSGTTWLAATLASTSGTVLVHEPDNPAFNAAAAETRPDHGGYPALDRGEGAPAYARLWDEAFRRAEATRHGIPPAQQRGRFRQGDRPTAVVAKSVFAAFAMEWLADRYAPRVVLIERDPLQVVSSWMRLGFEVGDLATRPRIRAQYVDAGDMPPWDPMATRALQVSWAVGVLMSALRRHSRAHPDWIVVSHDELCRNRPKVRSLASSLGLVWSESAEAAAHQLSEPHGSLAGLEAEAVSDYLDRFPELAVSGAHASRP